MKLRCLQCEYEFEGTVEKDELGWHSSCPSCGGSFDVDVEEAEPGPYDNSKVEVTFEQDEEGIPTVSATDGFLLVEWESIGEGHCGDYDPDDPEDEELLRFSVYVRIPGHTYPTAGWEAWEPVEDASYCTLMPVTASNETLEKAIRTIFAEYRRAICRYPVSVSVKKMGEHLSWIGDGE